MKSLVSQKWVKKLQVLMWVINLIMSIESQGIGKLDKVGCEVDGGTVSGISGVQKIENILSNHLCTGWSKA